MKAQRLGKLCLLTCYFVKPFGEWQSSHSHQNAISDRGFDHEQKNVVILTFKSSLGSFQIHNVIIVLSWVSVSKTLQPLPQIQTENYETKAGQRQGNISSCKQPHVHSFPRNPFISPK